MPSSRCLPRLPLIAVVASLSVVAGVSIAGCSKDSADRADNPGTPAKKAEQTEAQPSEGRIGLSAAGVTTRIDVPAQSNEEQYAQACMYAKDWMMAKGGDPDALVEPVLEEVQSSSQPGPAAFGMTWPQLSQAQQAAVIIAVRAAAEGGC
jgi:hypothetical protein